MRRIGWIATAVLAGVVAGCGVLERTDLHGQLRTASGVAAKQACSLVFVSGFELEHARALYVDPMVQEAASYLRIDVDRETEKVVARFPGLVRQVAQHRAGFGCTLVTDADRGLEAISRELVASEPLSLDEEHRDRVFDPAALEAALDDSFQVEKEGHPVNTLAVVVLHGGRLVAERYAPGVTRRTRLPGWSMAKSVTAALVGHLVQRGLLDVHAAGAISQWRGTGDPRAKITIDHLLRMTSGLALTETADRGDGLDPNSIMLNHVADAAGFAATRELTAEPGTHFEYMSGNYILAMRAAQDAIGGDLADAVETFDAEFFEPAGMKGVVFEADQSGTLLASSQLWATAHDWARFGQVLLDDGTTGGRRLLPEGWLAYATTPTPPSVGNARGDGFWETGRSAYGAGLWLFGPDGGTGLPPDAFDANGFQGQYVHVIPSRDLVVVRLGATNFRGFDHDRLPRQVVAAMRRHGGLTRKHVHRPLPEPVIAQRQAHHRFDHGNRPR